MVVDVREDWEWRSATSEMAASTSWAPSRTTWSQMQKAEHLVLVCPHGGRSLQPRPLPSFARGDAVAPARVHMRNPGRSGGAGNGRDNERPVDLSSGVAGEWWTW